MRPQNEVIPSDVNALGAGDTRPAEPRNTLVAAAVVVDPRLVWAAERTLLAWVRTGLGLMALGFVLARAPAVLLALGLPGRSSEAKLFGAVGVGLLALGVLSCLAAARRYARLHDQLVRGEPLVHSPRLSLGVAVAVALLGASVVLWAAGKLTVG